MTWTKGIDDPIVEWGQLLAYMPLVLKRRAKDGDHVFMLPKPALGRKNVKKPRALLGELASVRGESFPLIRNEARGIMREELSRRGLSRLEDLLE